MILLLLPFYLPLLTAPRYFAHKASGSGSLHPTMSAWSMWELSHWESKGSGTSLDCSEITCFTIRLMMNIRRPWVTKCDQNKAKSKEESSSRYLAEDVEDHLSSCLFFWTATETKEWNMQNGSNWKGMWQTKIRWAFFNRCYWYLPLLPHLPPPNHPIPPVFEPSTTQNPSLFHHVSTSIHHPSLLRVSPSEGLIICSSLPTQKPHSFSLLSHNLCCLGVGFNGLWL